MGEKSNKKHLKEIKKNLMTSICNKSNIIQSSDFYIDINYIYLRTDTESTESIQSILSGNNRSHQVCKKFLDENKIKKNSKIIVNNYINQNIERFSEKIQIFSTSSSINELNSCTHYNKKLNVNNKTNQEINNFNPNKDLIILDSSSNENYMEYQINKSVESFERRSHSFVRNENYLIENSDENFLVYDL